MKNTPQFQYKLEQLLVEHLDNDQLDINSICKKMGLSRMQLHRNIKRDSSLSTSIFIRNFRLDKARQKVISTSKRISQIAFEVGFKDPAYFCRCYKQKFGNAPTQERKKKLTTKNQIHETKSKKNLKVPL